MRGPARKLFVAGIAFAAMAAVAGSPAEASRRSCLKEADAGRVVALSKSSVAYERAGKLRACVFSADHSVLLPRQGDIKRGGHEGSAFIDPRLVRLAGRYVGYSWRWTQHLASANPPTVERVYVYDARFPELKNSSDAHESNGHVGAFFLKRNGSAAWTWRVPGSFGFPDSAYVYKLDSTGDGEQELDRSNLRPGPPEAGDFDIDDRSLALSGDGRRLYWTRTTDEVRTASIR